MKSMTSMVSLIIVIPLIILALFVVWEFFKPKEFIYVAGGNFIMGDTRGEGNENELPIHSINLNPFYVAKYMVTQKEYKKVMGVNPSEDYGVGDNYPVYNVNWYEAIMYCNRRSVAEGLTPAYSIQGLQNPDDWEKSFEQGNDAWDSVECNWEADGYRLPTEAEWEYAARGASNSPDYLYSGSDNINEVAWYSENAGSQTQAVGKKAPNALGIYDMSGNLFEWCWDLYSKSYYSESPSHNPTGASITPARVGRGGGWEGDKEYSRISFRGSCHPIYATEHSGFRLFKSAPKSK
ncbi:MAG: SUMF1/EgtB/PvdO family nonheme iron enzyme [Candidatus Cloacimonetes bacterium]|nr:SUMF1/EgtB/PvdO family nonheme iron enzyme [Candidatus Cloacimonadota bacterium]